MSSIACCQGEFDLGTPAGSEAKLGSLDCYFPLRPDGTPPPTTAVIIATDVFGWKVSNARLLADRLSTVPGVICVVPDYFNGSAANPVCVEDIEVLTGAVPDAGMFKKIYAVSRLVYYLVPFMFSNSRDASALRMKECIASMRLAHPSIKHVAIAGYCWGGHVAVKLSHDTSLGLSAVYSAHGGQLRVPEDYDLIRVPACIVHAGNDFEVQEPQVALIRKAAESNACIREVHVVADVGHGFAMRGSRKDAVVNEKRELAERMLVEFVAGLSV